MGQPCGRHMAGRPKISRSPPSSANATESLRRWELRAHVSHSHGAIHTSGHGHSGNLEKAEPSRHVFLQGFGKVGLHTMKYLHKYRASCICAGETDGATYIPRGTDPKDPENCEEDHGTIVYFPEAEPCDSSILEVLCDILIPASDEKLLTRGSGSRVRAKVQTTLTDHSQLALHQCR
ncbi:PREDICTED: glutamate dehydrogenase 2, mitochondrial-like [Chaetura pelagica]|uniref:glutamate dehydrogenase 2, mitochondrial-like n=1 Tax=Chaetura pelagica TaxID=8897 RepID=UPI00052329BD|nr:PREDICTED: glutamate dehydrogenase 2, mitochondrial-like [Chaetura pelagica]